MPAPSHLVGRGWRSEARSHHFSCAEPRAHQASPTPPHRAASSKLITSSMLASAQPTKWAACEPSSPSSMLERGPTPPGRASSTLMPGSTRRPAQAASALRGPTFSHQVGQGLRSVARRHYRAVLSSVLMKPAQRPPQKGCEFDTRSELKARPAQPTEWAVCEPSSPSRGL